jgi:alkaline phosphatase D
MAARGTAQKQQPQYARLRASLTRVVGIWDDHDYGMNDGGAGYSNKTHVRS